MYLSNYKPKCLMSHFSVTLRFSVALSHVDEFDSGLTKLWAIDGQLFVSQYLTSSVIISEKGRTAKEYFSRNKPLCNHFCMSHFYVKMCKFCSGMAEPALFRADFYMIHVVDGFIINGCPMFGVWDTPGHFQTSAILLQNELESWFFLTFIVSMWEANAWFIFENWFNLAEIYWSYQSSMFGVWHTPAVKATLLWSHMYLSGVTFC